MTKEPLIVRACASLTHWAVFILRERERERDGERERERERGGGMDGCMKAGWQLRKIKNCTWDE